MEYLFAIPLDFWFYFLSSVTTLLNRNIYVPNWFEWFQFVVHTLSTLLSSRSQNLLSCSYNKFFSVFFSLLFTKFSTDSYSFLSECNIIKIVITYTTFLRLNPMKIKPGMLNNFLGFFWNLWQINPALRPHHFENTEIEQGRTTHVHPGMVQRTLAFSDCRNIGVRMRSAVSSNPNRRSRHGGLLRVNPFIMTGENSRSVPWWWKNYRLAWRYWISETGPSPMELCQQGQRSFFSFRFLVTAFINHVVCCIHFCSQSKFCQSDISYKVLWINCRHNYFNFAYVRCFFIYFVDCTV